jgi:predicted phage-related endonuclease
MPSSLLENSPAEERQQWLLEHGRSIGGSSVGAIIGVNSYKTPAEVYDGLWNPSAQVEATAAGRRRMDRGHLMEPVIAGLYEFETGRYLRGDGRTRTPHPTMPYIHATPDRLIDSPATIEHATLQQGLAASAEGDGVWECKCLGQMTFNETLTRGVDPSYYAQIQLYMDVFRLTWGSFAIFNAEEWRLYWFDIPRDDRFIFRMNRRVETFWNEHVLARRRPQVADQIMTAPPLMPPPHIGAEAVVLDSDNEAVGLFALLRTAHAERKLANDRYDGLVETAKALMTRRAVAKARVGGIGKINWVGGTRRTFDKDALAREHPEIDLERYAVTSATSTFTFTPETRR